MDKSVFSPDAYRLGPYEIRGKENILASATGDVVILPKVMTLLLHLCRNSQKVVTFDELNDAIWPQEVVGDNAIYNLIGQLRKALGDSASKPKYIQTISKVGYRLLVEAKPLVADLNQVSNTSFQTPNISKRTEFNWWVPLITIFLVGIAIAIISTDSKREPAPKTQQQLKLAYYQLYRGDAKGVDQAIETLQQLVATEPSWSVPRVELAYGFIRKTRIEPNNKGFWLGKARTISSHNNLGKSGERLALIVDAIDNKQVSHDKLEDMFAAESVLTSARLTYSDLLFNQGQIQKALTQAQLALEACADCPYVYRKIATTFMLLGRVQEGFESFSRYRSLINHSDENPANNAGNVRLTMQSLIDMAHWHFQTSIPETLLPHQRNSLALFYLTLGQIEGAESLLSPTSKTSTHFFDLYTMSAIAGAKGDFETSYALLKKRQNLYPNNPRFKVSVVYALWKLGRSKEAMQAFDEFQIIVSPDSLPQIMSFSIWSLYAALLLEVGDLSLGKLILDKLENQLRAGIVPGSKSADIRLASILALQSKNQEALQHLELAISQGWVSDFNQNWWNIQDSPYFRRLSSDARFQQIAANYHRQIALILQQNSLDAYEAQKM